MSRLLCSAVKLIFSLAAVLSPVIMPSCSGSGNMRKLSDAEAVMDNNPDSALAILKSLEASSLSKDNERALYGLLITQAMDKNHIRIESDSLVEYAAEYFIASGDKERAMKALNYQGRVRFENNDLSKALVCYLCAYDLAGELGDPFWTGMTARGISDVYHDSFNPAEELRYATIERDSFISAGIQPYVNYALLDFSNALHSNFRFSEAVGLAIQLNDSAARYGDDYLKYAAASQKGLSLYGMGDYVGSISEFENIMDSPFMEPSDSIRLAMSYMAGGDLKRGKDMLSRINGADSILYLKTVSDMAEIENDIPRAYASLKRMHELSNSKIYGWICNDNDNAVVDHYNLVLRKKESDLRSARAGMWIIIVSALLLLTIILVVISRIYRNHKSGMKEKVLLADRLREELENSRLMTDSMNGKIRKILSSRYSLLEELCDVVNQAPNSAAADRKIARCVNNLIEQISVDDNKLKEFAGEADELYDNVYSDFVNDFPNLKEADYKLFLFSVFGFSNATMLLFLREGKISAVYDRKRRIKDKIRHSDSPASGRYLKYL